MKSPQSILMLLVLFVFSSHTFGQEALGDSSQFDEYYTVTEPRGPASDPSPNDQINPQDTETGTAAMTPEHLVLTMWSSVEELYARGVELYSLMKFDYHRGAYGKVVEPYNRSKHFGTWISANPKWNCFNTRAQVLVRESSVTVTMNPNGCTVATGRWSDPYSGRDFTQASDLQIDHFVALKNAYISGADKWTKKKRCLYANYQGNKFHLIPVDGKENSRKGDSTPERFMPTNRAYHCQYLAQWLKVKSIWNLALTPPEKEQVVQLVQQNHCTAADMAYSFQEISAQREYIANNMDLCQ